MIIIVTVVTIIIVFYVLKETSRQLRGVDNVSYNVSDSGSSWRTLSSPPTWWEEAPIAVLTLPIYFTLNILDKDDTCYMYIDKCWYVIESLCENIQVILHFWVCWVYAVYLATLSCCMWTVAFYTSLSLLCHALWQVMVTVIHAHSIHTQTWCE